MVWEETGIWEMSEGAVAPEPGHEDGEEKVGSRETEVEASLRDLADEREGGQAASEFLS